MMTLGFFSCSENNADLSPQSSTTEIDRKNTSFDITTKVANATGSYKTPEKPWTSDFGVINCRFIYDVKAKTLTCYPVYLANINDWGTAVLERIEDSDNSKLVFKKSWMTYEKSGYGHRIATTHEEFFNCNKLVLGKWEEIEYTLYEKVENLDTHTVLSDRSLKLTVGYTNTTTIVTRS